MKADEAREIADRAPKAISREELALAEIFRHIKRAAGRGKRKILIQSDDDFMNCIYDFPKVTDPLIALGYVVSTEAIHTGLDWRGGPFLQIKISWSEAVVIDKSSISLTKERE